MQKKSQNEAILDYIKRNWISSSYALKYFGCMRLAARIANLEATGHDIVHRWCRHDGKRWMEYKMRLK